MFRWALKKLKQLARVKGLQSAAQKRYGRNRATMTVVDLWYKVYKFKETPCGQGGAETSS